MAPRSTAPRPTLLRKLEPFDLEVDDAPPSEAPTFGVSGWPFALPATARPGVSHGDGDDDELAYDEHSYTRLSRGSFTRNGDDEDDRSQARLPEKDEGHKRPA